MVEEDGGDWGGEDWGEGEGENEVVLTTRKLGEVDGELVLVS